MLKTSSIKSTESRKGVVGVGSDSKAGRDGIKIVDGSGMDDVEVDESEVGNKEVRKDRKTSKN